MAAPVVAAPVAAAHTDGGNVGIDEVEDVQPLPDNRAYTLDGRYLGTEVPADFRGIYLQNGKKHLKLR